MTVGNSVRTGFDACPACGHVVDAASSLTDAETPQPAAGDVTVCLYCAAILTWSRSGADDGDERIALIKAPESVVAELAPAQRRSLAVARFAVKHIIARRARSARSA